ncbi:MAG: NGG1p interacting factor NIF3 [Candidatus Moranbacteria bacterium]|nr:NGG1p interacting factor NIF3 [Candidatus Moranbacteria bacterium]
MNIRELFSLAIDLGIQNDFRSHEKIQEYLMHIKKQYDELPKKNKAFFDTDRCANPYADCAIHHIADLKKDIKKVLAGIDIGGSELLVAERLSHRDSKNPIDLVIGHHPVGKALAGLDSVMDLQIDVFEQYGIPVNIAEGLMRKRISEVSRGVNPINHYQSVDIARILNISFLNIHTPSDNMVATFLKKLLNKEKPKYVGEILDIFMEIPEYKEATKQGTPPCLFAGSKENRVGKIALTEITGGTEGSPDMYKHIASAGIGTIIAMHQSERHRKEAEKAHINVVVAGHMSSDSIGMNLFLDELEKRDIEVIPYSGLIRYSRIHKK